MKTPLPFLATLLIGLFAATSPAQDPGEAAKTTLKLLSGETVIGKVGRAADGSVSVITDYGVMRVPVDKLSEESRAALGIAPEGDAEYLRKRIAELEQLVVRLREENAILRRSAATGPPPATTPAAGTPEPLIRPTPAATGSGLTYRVSSTGKRHNSRCRYYSSKGRSATATEGVACKICGG